MNAIERKIHVLDRRYIAPIAYKEGTNAIPIKLTLVDYEIPAGAAAKVYVAKPSGDATYNTATISGNSVTVEPSTDMFSESGKNNLFCHITKDSDVLFTFNVPVNVEKNPIANGGGSEGSNSPDIIQRLINRVADLEDGGVGSGVPDGGTAGQVLTKQSATDGDATWSDPDVSAQEVADLKSAIKNNSEKIDSLSEEIANKTGTGLSTEAIDKLEEVGNYLAYTTADGGSKWTELISILRNVELSNSAGLWEVGGVQPTGTGTTSTIRLRTVATLPYEVKKISVDDGYSYILVVYSEAQTEVPTDTTTVLLAGKGYYNPNGISGNVSTDSFLVSSGTYFNGELLISEVRANINSIYGNTAGDRAHFRILLKNNDDTTLTADDGLHIHLWG